MSKFVSTMVLTAFTIAGCSRQKPVDAAGGKVTSQVYYLPGTKPAQLQIVLSNESSRPLCLEGSQSIAAMTPLRFIQNGKEAPFEAFRNFKPAMYNGLNLAQPLDVVLPGRKKMLTVDLDDLSISPGKLLIRGEMVAYDCRSVFTKNQPRPVRIAVDQQIDFE